MSNDTSTTTISHEVAKQAYDNWERELSRCKEAFNIADDAASKVIKIEGTWCRKEKTLKDYITGLCCELFTERDYINKLHQLGGYAVYGRREALVLAQDYDSNDGAYSILELLGSGNDIQATAWVMCFINKWRGK